MARILWWLAGLALSGCIPGDGNTPADPHDTEPFVYEVPRGAIAKRLGTSLAGVGLVTSAWNWRIFLFRGADARCIKAGEFEVRRSMTMNELLATLCGPPLPDDEPFTVLEGWRIIDIDRALAAAGKIEAGAYTAAAISKDVELPFAIEGPTLEGYLYPETYRVPKGKIDPKQLIARQLQTFHDRFLADHPDGFGDWTLHEVVVIASMLETEERRPQNRPLISGIIHRRLARRMPLGIDATSHYKLPDWNDRDGLLKALADPRDPYNTRRRRGLPPTAVGNPTANALEAALAPEPGPWMYYLHDKDGNIHPAKTMAGHERNRRLYDVY